MDTTKVIILFLLLMGGMISIFGTSFVTVKFIQLVHLLLCLFVLLGPFLIKDREILIVYVVLVSFIIFHWILSSDVCALTLLEQWCTGKSSEFTFVGRLVKPVYNVTNRHIMFITGILLMIASIRLLKSYK